MANPKISVYTTCKNNGKYLRETLSSILTQTYADFEIVLVDGESTDDTLDILKSYETEKRLKWVSEPDDSPMEGFFKALSRCTGDYIMCMPISDKYIRDTWFQECVDILDKDHSVSMVHGMVKTMNEQGVITGDKIPGLTLNPLPIKESFFSYWLATFSYISEISYCVRASVYRHCYPEYRAYSKSYASVRESLSSQDFEHLGPHLKTIYNFNQKGYLTHFLPCFSSAGRDHDDALSIEFSQYLILEADRYCSDIKAYREDLFSGKQTHLFLDGNSNALFTANPEELSQEVHMFREKGEIHFGRYDEINQNCMKREVLFKGKCRKWLQTIGAKDKVLIYAGGQHTEQLLNLLTPDIQGLNIVGIIDKNPPKSKIQGIPVFSSLGFDFKSIDHVIISSKAFEDDIFDFLITVMPLHKIERIYG